MDNNKKIYAAIPAVMRDISAIGKDRRNQAQGFQFRGIDDVYNELHEKLAKHGVFTVPEILESSREERATKSGGAMTYTISKIRYTFYAEDGSSVQATVIGEGSDTGDKSTNKSMSVAHKYAFLQVFAIPTAEEKDPDADSHDLTPKAPIAPQARQNAPGPTVNPPRHIDPNKSFQDRPGPGTMPQGEYKISPKQRGLIFFKAKEVGWGDPEIKEFILAKWNIASKDDLTKRQMDELLAHFEKLKSQPNQTEPPMPSDDDFFGSEGGRD